MIAEGKKDRLKILCTNIRSLNNNHYNELLLLLTTDRNMDIIALSETWIDEDKIKFFPIDGYRTFVQPRKDGRRSGGVILYVKEHLKLQNMTKKNMVTGDLLQMDLQIHDRKNKRDVVVTLIHLYRDSTSSKKKFTDELQEIVSVVGKNVLLIGDMNVDILDPLESAEYLNMIQAQGFNIEHNEPTRDESCLDHVMLRPGSTKTIVNINPIQITDHKVINIEVSITAGSRVVKELCEATRVHRIDENKFMNILCGLDWEWVEKIDVSESENNVNKYFGKLYSCLESAQQQAMQQVSYKGNKKSRQPWMTKTLLKLVQKKSEAYKLHRNDRTNSALQNEFKKRSKEAKKELRKAQKKYYTDLLYQNFKNPKKYWETVNQVRGLKKENSIMEITTEGEKIMVSEDPARVAETFNEYFNQVPTRLVQKLHLNNSDAELEQNQNNLQITVPESTMEGRKLDGLTLTESDVEQAINVLNNKKSTGWDNVTSTMIKNKKEFFAHVLTPLFNISLKFGYFPDQFKKSVIIPIYKQGERDNVGNYRPVSLSNNFSKVFEKCVKSKLLNYLEHIDYFSPYQYGFLKDRSTDAALFNHVTQIISSIEQNKATVGVYLDLAKAFDTISHKKLIHTLRKIGIEGPLLDWFRSYLEGRTHKVKINGVFSKDKISAWGVPQGSVLGPILFNIYINGLFSLPLKALVIAFADDTSLLYSAATKEDLEENYKHDMRILFPWLRNKLLHLNVDKCKYVIYAYKTPVWAANLNLQVNEGDGGGKIDRVAAIKYLGLTLDEKLTWKNYSLELQGKLRKLNYLFYHMKNFFNTYHLKKLYNPLYESAINYGIIHWGGSHHIAPLKVLQNKVCRIILNMGYRTSETEIYPKMKVLKIENLYKLRMLTFVFKNKGLFQVHDSMTYSRTGGGTVAAYPKWMKHHSRIQARYRGFELFNKLPNFLRGENSISKYKKCIRDLVAGG